MARLHGFLVLATTIAIGGGCASTQASSAGEVIDPAEAAKTVVLHVDNVNPQPMELRTLVSGRSMFVGSVGGNDSTSVLLDPTIFPTGFLYVIAIPADGRGRAVGGPLSAAKGDQIRFSIQPALEMSHAIVIH